MNDLVPEGFDENLIGRVATAIIRTYAKDSTKLIPEREAQFTGIVQSFSITHQHITLVFDNGSHVQVMRKNQRVDLVYISKDPGPIRSDPSIVNYNHV